MSRIIRVQTSRLHLRIVSNKPEEEIMLHSSNNLTQKITLRLGKHNLDLQVVITNRDLVFTIWDTIQMLEVSKIVFSNNNNSSNQITVIHKCILWTFRTRPLLRDRSKITTNPQNHLKLETAWSSWIRVVFNINNSKSLHLKALIQQNQDRFLYNKRDPPNQEDLAQQSFLKKRLIEPIHKMSIITLMEVDNQVKTWLISYKRRWRRDMKALEVDVKLWMHLGSNKTLSRMLQALEPKNIVHRWLLFTNRMVQCQLWLLEELAVSIWTTLVHTLFLISHHKTLEIRVAKLEITNTEKGNPNRSNSEELLKVVRVPLLQTNQDRVQLSMEDEKSSILALEFHFLMVLRHLLLQTSFSTVQALSKSRVNSHLEVVKLKMTSLTNRTTSWI